MNIDLAYDTSGLTVALPDANVAAVLRHSPADPVRDERVAVEAALNEPIGSPPLEELARGRRSACVLICDHTRPSPDRVMLPALLRTIEQAGIGRDHILVLVATGLHRPSTTQEIERMVGPAVARDYHVENHDARDASAHRLCCTTSDGTRAELDRRFLDADLKLATGFVEPHLMAGFGGGRKMVAPGVASADTICQLHSPRVLEDRACREGNLEGNVLHRAAGQIARAAGLEFILHVTMDERRRITAAFAGEPSAAFGRAVDAIRGQVTAALDRPCDIAVTSGGGFPLDATYYQTIKGVTAAMPAVRPGGTILVASGCREGLGSDDFQQTLGAFSGFDEFRAAILDPHKPYFRIDQWQHEQMSHANARAQVVLAQSRLSAEQRARLWVRSTDCFADALFAALERHGRDARIAVLPQGPYVLVECAAPSR